MAATRIVLERLLSDLEHLRLFGGELERGITRPVFSEPYEKARAWLLRSARDVGMDAWSDAAGNVIIRLGGRGSRTLMIGSHIDTVDGGGHLDGAYGVLAGLEVARVLLETGNELPLNLDVVAFADEEGRYVNCLGSRAMAGLLRDRDVEGAVGPDGRSLKDALAGAGFSVERMPEARRDPSEIAAYVELHIEQGPVLEAEGLPIGVVEAIVGSDRSDVVFVGEAGHAGTTPMELRKDAFMGAAEYAFRAREVVAEHGDRSTRLTFGIIEAEPQVTNVVPRRVRLRQEVRETDGARLAALCDRLLDLAQEVAVRHRLTAEHRTESRVAPAAMSPLVMGAIEAVSRQLNLPCRVMPSGAGHDAQVMAEITNAGMIFVPSAGGRSHRSDEHTEPEHLEQGANVLLHTVLRLMEELRS